MKVLLLGATGRTGNLILGRLIEKGHIVNVIVRDRGKVLVKSPNLTIHEGSTLDATLIKAAIIGCDAVISALNVSRSNDFPWSALRTPKTLMSDTIKLIITLANVKDVSRIIVLSAWGVNETTHDLPWWFRWTIKYSNIKYAYQDHEVQEGLLMDSGLNWTIIRPVGLINSKVDKPIKVVLAGKELSLIISRQSVANFTVDVLEHNRFVNQKPAISWE